MPCYIKYKSFILVLFMTLRNADYPIKLRGSLKYIL